MFVFFVFLQKLTFLVTVRWWQSKAEFSAPLTGFSWSMLEPTQIVTASIDTVSSLLSVSLLPYLVAKRNAPHTPQTCTVWDISTGVPVTQLIAHDREVYDVAWSPAQREIFASVGADGSVRMFDLRSLEHSTILYEAAPSPSVPATSTTTTTSSGSGGGGGSSGNSSAGTTTAGGKEAASGTGGTSPSRKKTGGGGGSSSASSSNNNNNNNNNAGPPAPLLRLAFSPTSPNYLAVVHADSPHVQILDTRSPGTAALEVRGHKAPVNGIAWGAGGTGATMSGASGGGGNGPGWLSTVCESIPHFVCCSECESH